jgi:FkbM family methyltransferase
MTSAMAVASGSSGAVLAFEPQPILFGELAYNVAQWQQDDRSSPIAAHNIALSDHSGTSQLMVPANFYGNRGLSYLIESPVHAEIDVVAREVEVSTLDEAIEPGKRVALMKLDVEGAELHVLKGAERLLKSGLIRDILFEEHRTLPTPVTSFLDALGYSLFLLDARLMGPTIVPVGSRYAPASRDAPNYLATLDPKRAIARMTPRYWKVYSGEYPGHYS